MANLTTMLRDAIRAGEGMASILPILETSEWVDIAAAAEGLDPEELQAFVDLLPSASVAMLMEGASDPLRATLCCLLSDHQLLVVLGRMQNDDAADVLGSLEPKRLGEVLSQMRSADRLVLTDLLRYPDETAGSIMTTTFVSVRSDQTAGDCLAVLRDKASKVEQIQTVFVLAADGALVGWLDLRKILSSKRNVPVSSCFPITPRSTGTTSSSALLASS